MESDKKKKFQSKFVLKNDCNKDLLSNREEKHEKNMNVLKRAEKNKSDTKELKENKFDNMDVPTPVVKQIENSELELNNYTEEGSQLVTNVLLANENRENNRRNTDKNERDIRLKAVELESEMANAKLMEISNQWPLILKKNDALDIHEHLELQKKRGFDLIEQKNQMIEILKRDLVESDSRFLYEQFAQSEDVRILQERIENQVKFIRKQYKSHIQYIKSTMDQQRGYRIDKATDDWKNLYNETMSIESNSLDDRLAMIEKKENNIMKQYEMNEETIRNLKSNINTELHLIQREFDLIKMKCLENIEKLNYNYQVLKRREEENACAKAAQRRKINKLQDIISTKRKILRETKTDFEAKVPLLKDEIEKLKQDIERHEKKAKRFADIQEKTYKELWDFSQDQISNHLNRIFEIDQIIHETQLGINWQPPQKLKYLDVSHLPSYRKKPDTPNTENLRVEGDQQNAAAAAAAAAADSYAAARERALLKLVFDAIVKNVSLVLDGELIGIVESHPKGDLALLYNAMAAYGLNTVGSWKCLLSCARSTATCAICRGPVLWRDDNDADANRRPAARVDSERTTGFESPLIDNLLAFARNHTEHIENAILSSAATNVLEKTRPKNHLKMSKQNPMQLDINAVIDTRDYQSFERANTDTDNSTITFSLSLTDFEQLYSENDSSSTIKSQHSSFSQVELEHFQMISEDQTEFIETSTTEFNQCINEEKDFIAQKIPCDNPNHPLELKDTDYLRIIKKSIDTTKSKAINQRGKNSSDFYLTDTLSIKDISDYWRQFLYAFPEDRLKLWDVFDKAIKKYYQTLHLCCKKTKETDKIEIENLELKKILKQFMDAEQDDVRLQNICTPKIRKQQINSSKRNKTQTLFKEDSTNICGKSIRILTVNRPPKPKISRPFTAPTK